LKITPAILRRCGRRVLESRGYVTKPIAGERIIPGTRLEATKSALTRTVAVRTSLGRKLGFLRQPDGRWQTISTVDQVLVVARSLDEELAADVMCFESAVLLPIFEKSARGRPKDHYTHPMFMRLDDANEGSGIVCGLKSSAAWQTSVLIAESAEHGITALISCTGFVERVKREFAELAGVDVSRVIVDFRITR
jgi:hypothetical protein